MLAGQTGIRRSSRRRVRCRLSKLAINTTYHFRVAARNAFGTSFGTDTTFTTLATFASAETSEPAKPAKATDGQLRWKAAAGPAR